MLDLKQLLNEKTIQDNAAKTIPEVDTLHSNNSVKCYQTKNNFGTALDSEIMNNEITALEQTGEEDLLVISVARDADAS